MPLHVRHLLRILLPFVLLITAFPSFGAELSIQFEQIARVGDTSVPNGVGTFSGVGPNPAIDSDGNVMFTAAAGLDNNGKTQGGVYTFINGQLQTVADYNTLVPGGGGATFTKFSGGDKNDIDGGRVAFLAQTSSSSTVVGLYSNVGQSTANNLFEVAVVDGSEWESIDNPWVDGDTIAMPGKRLVPDSHDTILRISGSDLSTNFVNADTGYNLISAYQASISGNATLFRSYNPTTGIGEFTILSDGVYEPLAQSGITPVPGQSGVTFSTFDLYPVIDNGGLDAAFGGRGDGGAGRGVYKRINGGALTLVANDDMVVPGGTNNGEFNFFDEAAVTLANGQVVFKAQGPLTMQGLYTDIGGALAVIFNNGTSDAIELAGQTEYINDFKLSSRSFAYTPNGYEVVFWAQLLSGDYAIIRATISISARKSADTLFKGGFER
jgi:hypothetical protein